MAETKHDKFVRLRDARLDRTTHAVRLIGNLANKTNYDYTREEALAVIRELQSAVVDVATSFGLAPQKKPASTMPPSVAAFRAAKLDHGMACWAYECLQRGEITDAKAHLKKALYGIPKAEN